MAYNSPAAHPTDDNTVSDSLDIEISHNSLTMTCSPPANISSVEHTTSETAQSFTPFPKLPQELMDMVWSFALPGTRIVAFESEMVGDTARDFGRWLRNPIFRVNVNAIATVLLHTCAQSRQLALHRYEAAFSRCLKHPIYIDWDRDTVFIKDDSTWAFIAFVRMLSNTPTPLHLKMWQPKIRHIAAAAVPTRSYSQKKVLRGLYNFTNLSTLAWVWRSSSIKFPAASNLKTAIKQQIREMAAALWKEKLEIDIEVVPPKIEFITEQEMKARFDD